MWFPPSGRAGVAAQGGSRRPHAREPARRHVPRRPSGGVGCERFVMSGDAALFGVSVATAV